MGSVLAPPMGSTVRDQGLDELVGLSLGLGILAIENNTDNVI